MNQPWIVNVAVSDIAVPNHPHVTSNDVLIQILDPGSSFPVSPLGWRAVHQFEFVDREDSDLQEDPDLADGVIQPQQAQQLVAVLRDALQHDSNVVVQCFAGLCRSGAVVEMGVRLGFAERPVFRSPNTRVMRLMSEACGMPYTVEPHSWREDYRRWMSVDFERTM